MGHPDITIHASPGDQVVILGVPGLIGTAYLWEHNYDELHTRYPAEYLSKLEGYYHMVGENRRIICEMVREMQPSAAIMAMYGGIYGALYHLGYDSGLGMRVRLADIRSLQPVNELANYYDINPYKLYSDGCAVITASDGQEFLFQAEKAGIPAAVAGHMTRDKARIVVTGEGDNYLTPVRQDALCTLVCERQTDRELTSIEDEKWHWPRHLENITDGSFISP